MKTVWTILALLSLPALAYCLWLAHTITFGMVSHNLYFESEPPEGWEYWLMREARGDLIRFLLYSLVPVCISGYLTFKALRATGPEGKS